MAVLTIDFPGIKIIDQSVVTNRAFPFGVCYIIGSATTGISKKLTKITDKDQFVTLFGTLSESQKYIESFFLNLTGRVDLYFYRVNAGSGVTNVPAVQTDYLTAITALDFNKEPGGIIICPEYWENELFDEDDRAEIATAIDTFCTTDSGSYWISFVDTNSTLITANTVVTARKNDFVSPKGNLYVYAPSYTNTADVLMAPSAAMAAISLSLWSTGQYFLTPAGSQLGIKGIKSLSWNPTKTDLTLFHAEGVNAIRYFSNTDSYVPYDSISVSDSVEYFQLNSVVCFKVVAFLLYEAVLPLVHSSLYGTAEALTRIEAVINKVLYDSWISGYLVGRNANEAFDVQSNIQTLPAPNSAIVSFACSVRPSFSIQKILIYLQNVLAQTN